MLSRRTNLPLFLQPTTFRTDGHYIVYFTYVPAYTKRHARRDFDRDHSRYSRTVSRREIGDRSRASLATKMYTSCPKDYIYIRTERQATFLLTAFSLFYFRSFCSSNPLSFVRQSPGTPRANRQCVPARQPCTVNTRRNVHAYESGVTTRMRSTRTHWVQSPEQVHRPNTPVGSCRCSSTP